MFGTFSRFKYQIPIKSKYTKVVPGPSHYDIQTPWKGKEIKINQTINITNNYLNHLSKGINKSIYY